MRTPLLFIVLALLVAPLAHAQSTAWDSRLSALEEERAAQAGVAVSIIFDDSGSMSERNKMDMAKQAFRQWIADAPAGYRFGLVALNAGRLAEMGRNNKPQILAAVDRLEARGATPLADAIARAGKEIDKRRASGAVYERQVAVILTDGEDSTDRGISGVQQEMRRLRAAQVEVIAFGYQGEGEYMRDCATHYFSPDNAQDIRRGLNAIAAEVGDTSDIVVDDATRARMQAAADKTVAAASPPAPAPAAFPQAVPRTSGGWLWKGIVLAVVVAFLLQRARRR